MRLYSKAAQRLYLNKSERQSFADTAEKSIERSTTLLCLTLLHTGCRLSEALNLKNQDIQVNERLVAINSLKKRDKHHVREIPIPSDLADQLAVILSNQPNEQIWSFSRTSAWRKVTGVMHAAGIYGQHATPKGLRHSFGVHCAFNNVPMPLAQKWMGHSDIQTTAIYYQIIGKEEREMASRLWQ